MDRNEIKYEMFEELKIHRNMNMLELDNEQCLDIARFMSKIAVNQLKNNGGLGAVVGQSEQFFAFTDDYFKRDKEIAEALRPEFEYWLENKGK